jgi:DNA-binding LacI/PurR family transcriptional regulator
MLLVPGRLSARTLNEKLLAEKRKEEYSKPSLVQAHSLVNAYQDGTMSVTSKNNEKALDTKRSAMPSSRPRATASHVMQSLDSLCETLGPGGRIPTHTELMRRYAASERAVREALDELQRSGRIVRRNGVGTFVASSDQPPAPLLASSRTIVAITRPDRAFFDRCMDLLFRHAEDADLSLVCQPVADANARQILTASAASKPLGFLLFGYWLAPLAERLQAEGWRVVVVGAPHADITPTFPTVYHDHNQGGYLVTRHLISLGHRRIAFARAGGNNIPHHPRWQGHQRALREARREGKEIHDTLIPEEETAAWATDSTRAAAYFQTSDAPTALISWNDHEAAKVLTALIRAGVRVPDQVSLAGYDDLPEGALVYPRLTTVDQSIGEQLRAAVDLLTRPAPLPPTHTVVFVPSLLPHESTAPLSTQ